MVKLDLNYFKYASRDEFRTLIAIEMGMKNHNVVPIQLINSISNIKRGDLKKSLTKIHKEKMVFHENKSYSGYRLTYRGYDYLAIRAHTLRNNLDGIGSKLGTGKESDVFVGRQPSGNKVAVKFHRLGRISFRTIKINRDYHKNRTHCSWLYLSRLAALKEFVYMKILYENGFPVPKPIDVNRHVLVMEYLDNSHVLNHLNELKDPENVYCTLMNLLVSLASCGIIHGDFNEFNLMVDDDDNVTLIDFPQVISIDHPNAEIYFDRDVECIRSFFKRRFGYESSKYPKLCKITRKFDLDKMVRASGFSKDLEDDFNNLVNENENALSESDEFDQETCSVDSNASVEIQSLIKDQIVTDDSEECVETTNDSNWSHIESKTTETCPTKEKRGQSKIVIEDGPEYEQVAGETRKQRKCRLRSLQLQRINNSIESNPNEPQSHDENSGTNTSDVSIHELKDELLEVKRLELIRTKVKYQLDKKRKTQKIKIKNEFKHKARREAQLEGKRLATVHSN